MVIKYRALSPWGKYWGILDKYPTTYNSRLQRYTFFDPISLVPLNSSSRSPIKRKIMNELGIINPKTSSKIRWVKLTQDFLLIAKQSYQGVYSLDFYSRKTRKKFLIIKDMIFRSPVIFKQNLILERIVSSPFLNSISIEFLRELEKSDKITEYKWQFDPEIKGTMGIENSRKFGYIEKMFVYNDGFYIRTKSLLLKYKSLGEDFEQLQP